MQKFWWPGYEMQLLGELQKQQNSAQFCDTLLQTEDISVPTHSCILAAFSPYLFQKLSASPSPPCGQKRRLQLRAVTAQTLLKLVGLLYSGELEVKGGKEQNDVMAAARQFGITGLVAGHKEGGRKREGVLLGNSGSFWENGIQKADGRKNVKMQDAQVQAEVTEKRGNNLLEMKINVSVGTQTVKTGEMSGSSASLSDQIAPPIPKKVSSAERPSALLQPQNVTPDKQFCLTACPVIPSNGESTAGQLSGSATNPASSSLLSNCATSVPDLVSKEPSSPRSQEENISQQSPRSGDSLWVSTNESQEWEDESVDGGGHAEQLRHVRRDETLGRQRANCEDRRHLHAKAGMKNLAKMLQMETTKISFKVKLKRRTKGEMWEVVALQDADEAFSVHTSSKQGCSNQEAVQKSLTDGQPPTETQNSRPLNATVPKTPNHSSSSFDPSSSGSDSLNQSSDRELLPQPQGAAEETDEQIERWLEDIMMGLNILSNLDNNCEKSELNHDGALTCGQAAVAESDIGQNNGRAAVGAGGRLFFQDLGTQSSSSSTDTGTHYCFPAQSQSSYSSLSSVPPDFHMHQRSQFFSSVKSSGRSAGMSGHGLPLSRRENFLCPETAPAGSVWSIPSSFSEQKLHDSALQQPAFPKDQTVLDFGPFSHDNKAQSEHVFHASLPCMDDLRLPPRLSPLEAYTGAAPDLLFSNSSANPDCDIQKQQSFLRRPWLTETPMSLQFPLRAIIGSQTTAPPQNANSMCRTFAEFFSMTGANEKKKELPTQRTSDPKKLEESLSCTQHKAATKRRRRRRTYCQRDGDDVTLASKKPKVRASRNARCVVSLSSKNVLLMERQRVASHSDTFSTSVEKTGEVSTFTGTVVQKTSCPETPGTEQTRIRTRGFVRSQEKTGNTVNEVSRVLIPVVRRATVVNKQGGLLLKRKRGRPPKIKLEERCSDDAPPTSVESSNHNEATEKADKDLSKVDEVEMTKSEGRKRKRNTAGAEGVPLKKALGADCSTKPERDNNNNTKNPGTSKQSWVATLKEFQKLIKQQQQQSKAIKSKESQKNNEAARDVEGDEKAKGQSDPAQEAGSDVDITDNAKAQHQGVLSFIVDENELQIFNTAAFQCGTTQPNDSRTTATEETSTLEHEDHSEVDKLPAEELLKNPDDGALCDLSAETMPSASRDKDAPLDNSHLLQENLPIAQVAKSSHPTSEKSDPLIPGPDGIKSISECSQEEEEEVDVLVFSPEKNPPAKEYEDGLSNTVLSPDEEEEEEVNEIDVTGDETE